MKARQEARLAAGLLLAGLTATLPGAQESIQRRSGSPLDDSNVDLRRTPVVEVVERARPAVVSIETNVPERRRTWLGQIVLRDAGASGTGVVIYEDGYIVTNNHVVGNAGQGDSKILVRFDEEDDSRVYEATLISREPKEDLALIKIEGGPFPTIPMSDQKPLLGETVIAIGNALRHTHTVSQGIISGLHREVSVRENELEFENLIQTDASINPGNSGGPLLNIYGELIGINTVISAGAENIGFAIPVARVKDVLSRKLLDLRQARAYLGVEFDVERREVSAVISGGPADEAGLQPGDRIVAIGDKTIEDAEALRLARLAVQPREAVRFEIERSGRREQRVLLAWSPADGVIHDALGVRVRPADMGTRSRPLVQIESVQESGPAGRIGLEPGDVLVAVRPEGYSTLALRQPRDLALLLLRLAPGTTLDIEIFRDDDGDGRFERDGEYSELYRGKVQLR